MPRRFIESFGSSRIRLSRKLHIVHKQPTPSKMIDESAADAGPVHDLANRSFRLHDGRERPRRSRHGQLRRDGGNGINVDLRSSAIACAASRAWSRFWAIRSR